MAKRYLLNLRGSALRSAQIWALIMPAYLLFGWNNAVTGPLLGLPSWVETFPGIDTNNTTGEERKHHSTVQGTVVAIYNLGAFFGALSCIWVGDRLGRIRTIQLGALFDIIGAMLQATSFSLPQLIVGRVVTGFGFGALSATAPNWQSECSKSNHRGAVVILESVFISAGLAFAAWIDLGMSFVTTSASWRFPLAMSGFWALIVLVLAPLLPESPRWLVLRGRKDEARAILSALDNLPEQHPSIEADLAEISESVAVAGRGRFVDIFKNGELRLFNRTCLASAGQMFQQLSGINVLGFYQATIFQQNLGFSSTISGVLTGSVFTFQTLCAPIGVLTVDRLGRRKLMMISAIGMGACMAIIAGTVKETHSKACLGVATAFIFLFSLFFPVGFLGMTFLYASEISPLTYRVPITAISTSSAWIFTFLVTEVTPTGISTIGYRYFIVYACTNFFLILPSVWLFFPETNGRHLEEVDQIFRDSNTILDPVKMARQLPTDVLRGDLDTAAAEKNQDVEQIDDAKQ